MLEIQTEDSLEDVPRYTIQKISTISLISFSQLNALKVM